MKTEQNKRSKHEYSTFALLFLFFLVISSVAVATTGAGVDGSIQFNDNGTTNGSSEFTFNKTTGNVLLENGSLTVGVYGETGDGLYVYGPQASGSYPQMIFNTEFGSLSAGLNTEANSLSAIALGYEANASGLITFAVHGKATQNFATAIGYTALATGQNGATAIGYNARANGSNSMAIGPHVSFVGPLANGANSIAFGPRAETTTDAQNGVAFGANAYVSGSNGIAMGFAAKSDGGIAIGNSANASTSSMAIGTGTQTSAIRSMMLGFTNNLNNPVINNNTDSILLGFQISGTQYDLLEASQGEGVRIGARTGELLNMTGDDFYVKDNAQVGGFLLVGSNDYGNLTSGDINASILYADAVIYKSPKFNCDGHTKICDISVIGRDTSIEVQFDDNFNPLSITHKDMTYTPQQFNQQVCNANSNNREDCDRIIDKWQRLSCERDDANVYLNGECYTNPYYACEYSVDKVWNFATNSCVFDEQKFCESQGDVWNGTDCNTYVAPQKTTAQLREECLNNKATIWYNTKCISIETYYQ